MSDVTIPGGKIRAFVERIENLDTELLELNEQKKEVFAEAKGEGFDVKILKEIIKLQSRTSSISICVPWSRPGQRRSPRLHDEVGRVRSPQLLVIASHPRQPAHCAPRRNLWRPRGTVSQKPCGVPRGSLSFAV
jgi:uncharacterized protein (UPF0335 family)